MPNVNNNVQNIIPIGNHVFVDGGSSTITIPDNATGIMFQITDATGYYTIDDGTTTPTSTIGFQFPTADPPIFLHLYPGAVIRINATAGGDIQYQFFVTSDHHSLTSRR